MSYYHGIMIIKKLKYKNAIHYEVIFGNEFFEIHDHLKPRNITPYNPKSHKQVVLLRKSKTFVPNAFISSMASQIACFDTVKEAKSFIKNRKYL
jgi:hypothetical protein